MQDSDVRRAAVEDDGWIVVFSVPGYVKDAKPETVYEMFTGRDGVYAKNPEGGTATLYPWTRVRWVEYAYE